MRKDYSQLLIIPTLLFGMLGYSFSMRLLRVLSSLFGLEFQTMSLSGISHFQLSIAALFALVPVFSYTLFQYEHGGAAADQPLKGYWRNLLLLLAAALVGVAGELYTFRLLHTQLQEASEEGIFWTSYLEQLQPFTVGLGAMLVVATLLFFWLRAKKKR